MEFKPTRSAEKLRSVPVAFIDVPARRTFLRREPGVYKGNGLPDVFCFIPDKLFKLVERPVIQFPVKCFTASFLHSDFSEVFECKHSRFWGLNYLFRDTVVNVSHKPSFSTGYFPEFPFSGSSAFRLQLSAKVRIFSADILHRFRIVKCVVRTDSNINEPSVYSENRYRFYKFRCPGLNLTMQVKRVIILTERQSRRFNLPCFIPGIVTRYMESSFDPPIRGSNSSIPGIKTNPDYTRVVPHRRELFSGRFRFTFNGFQRFTRTIPGALYQRRREIRNCLSDSLVRGGMAINFVTRMGVKPPVRTDVKRDRVIPHSFIERLFSIGTYIKFQPDSPNHNHILKVIGIKCNSINEVNGAIHPTAKAVGFLAPRS